MTKELIFADAQMRNRRGDEQFALEQIVDAAIANKVNHVFGLGDLLDRQTNRSAPVVQFQEQIRRLGEHGIEFGFIQGNHDYDDPPWLTGIGRHLHGQRIEYEDHTYYGLDFQPLGKLQDALKAVPENVDTLLCHQTWGDWMGDITVPQGVFADVPGHITCVVTGDYHQWVMEKVKNADGNEMLVCSPGALCMQKADEPNEHFYLLVVDGNLAKRKLRSRVFLDSPKLLTPEDLDQFLDGLPRSLDTAEATADARKLPPNIRQPLLRVTYSSSLPDVVRRLTKLVGESAYLVERELPPESKREAFKAVKAGKTEAVTPLSVLADEVSKKDNPEVFGLVGRLLHAADPAGEFENWRLEQLGDV